MIYISKIFESTKKYYEEENYGKALELIERCLVHNRRSALQLRNQDQRIDSIKEHAEIKLLQGNIHFKMGKYENALLSYKEAKKKLATTNSTSFLQAQLNYQMSKIATVSKKHEDAVDLMRKTIDDLIAANKYKKAINHLFKVMEYSNFNNIDINYDEYIKRIELLSNKRIKDKVDKSKIKFEILKIRGDLIDIDEPNKSLSELKKIVKKYGKHEVDRTSFGLRIKIARLELYKSYSKALEITNKIMINESLSNFKIERSLNQFHLSALLRMQDNIEETAILEQEAIKTLDNNPDDSIKISDILTEQARIILLTSNDNNQLEIAKTFTERAYAIYKEAEDKNGKLKTKLIEGCILISQNARKKGNSVISLATINAKRMTINQNIKVSVDTISNIIPKFLQTNPDELRDAILSSFHHLPLLEVANLYQILGIIKSHENIVEALELLKVSKNCYKKIYQKDKDLIHFQKIIETRIQVFEFLN